MFRLKINAVISQPRMETALTSVLQRSPDLVTVNQTELFSLQYWLIFGGGTGGGKIKRLFLSDRKNVRKASESQPCKTKKRSWIQPNHLWGPPPSCEFFPRQARVASTAQPGQAPAFKSHSSQTPHSVTLHFPSSPKLCVCQFLHVQNGRW